tara:strand:+ start:54 stop:320 length:267 start_codon:yes stop_codon:yes gene_type:complete
MIAEVKLILDLLRSTEKAPEQVPVSPQAVKQTEGSLSNLAGVLFEVGPIVEIKQPVVIPEITTAEATQWWLEATEGIPITSLPYLGKR